ncbi:hypothetical protein CHU98_g848, partial [Xylaria longipes]
MGGGPGQYRSVAYFVNWAIYGRKHRPQDLPVEKLTHVLYAFANVRPESAEPPEAAQPQPQGPALRWRLDVQRQLQAARLHPRGRATFANSCVELVKNLGFDGIDIDWEYPQSAEEAANYVALLQAVRAALDAYGAGKNAHFELTVACPAGAQNYDKLDIPGMDASLDF